MTTHGTAIGEWANASNQRKANYLVILDSEGQISFCNSQFFNCFLAGHSAGDPGVFFNLVHASDRQQLSRVLSTCALRDQAVHSELRIKNDHFRWVDWEISQIRKPENMSDKFLCLGAEIAIEEQYKKSIESFQQHYQQDNSLFLTFMEHTPWFTWIADEEDNLMYGNKSLLDYFHLDPAEFGKGLSGIIPGPIASIFAEKHRKVLQGDNPEYSLAKWSFAGGDEREYRIIAFPIRSVDSATMIGGIASPLQDHRHSSFI